MLKKRLKNLIIVTSSILCLMLVIALTMRYTSSIADADLNIQVSAILDDNSCLVCHTSDAKEPFYSNFPVIGPQVKKDIKIGLRAFNMDNMLKEIVSEDKISEVNLAKIENVIQKKTMPLEKFNAIHWGSYINENETNIIINWVNSVRKKHYSTNLACKEFENKALQPMVDEITVNSAMVALGDKMFHDTRLSIDNTISCASCHGLETGGVDNLQFSEGVHAQFGDINAPTVYNAAFNHVQFWDGRAADLSEQAAGPPANPVEMGDHTWEDICVKLNKDNQLIAEFKAIYNTNEISQQQVTDVIAEFEKTLITPDTRFDEYLKGDLTALNTEEIDGLKLFEQYDCHTCHVGQNLGGQSFEYLGVYKDYLADRGNMTKADNGRFNFTAKEIDKHKFKTPTLRNIEITAPYYHDGTIETIEDAVEKMVIYQTIHETITKEDTKKITSFLKSLTSQKLANNKTAPQVTALAE